MSPANHRKRRPGSKRPTAKTAQRARRVVRKAERFARATLDALSAHIAILDKSGVIVAVNRAWRDFAEANHPPRASVCEGANYLAVCDAVRGTDAPTAKKFARAVRGIICGKRREFSLEYPCHSPDEERWFEVRITRFSGQGTSGLVVAHENITGRKRAEEALRESEERQRLAATAAGFGTYTYDFASGTSYWSPELKVLLGVRPDQPLPLDEDKLFAGLHPEDRAAFLAAMTAANDPQGSGLFRHEYRVVHPDGTVRWLHVRGRTIFTAEGAAMLVAGVVLDITERKQAESQLQLSQQQLSLHVEQTPLAVIEFDVTGRVRQWNPAAVATFGYSREEAMGQYWSFIMPVAIHGQLEGIWADIVGQRGGRRSTNDNITKDGRTISCEWFNTPLVDQDGRTIGVASLIQDITERKHAEDKLRESREQMRALAARLQAVREEERTKLAREMHDVLAQELTRLKIDLVWLERRLARPGPNAATEGLAPRVAEMSQVADTAIHCVQRIATGLRPAVLDSLGLCAAVEWQAKDFQAHSGITCQASVPELEPRVSHDVATATFRILQESLTNVLRHAYATQVDVSLLQEAGHLVLRVADNGCGIRPKALSNPMSIGLAGMRERALLLGGKFEIQSQLGSGTTIEMHLPLTPAGPTPDPTR